MATERVQKILAAAGIASRRASEELIAQGRVTVDGEVVELGAKADPTTAEIRVDGERVNADPAKVYVMLNKPRGVVTTADDPQGRPTVVDLVNLPQRLFPVGRLDLDTEGLLLLTNDGELAHALTHPSYEVPRTYVALVNGPVRKRVLADLRGGVELEDGPATPVSVRLLEEQGQDALLEIVLAEGRNREVRRMVDAVGLTLRRLARVAYGGVEMTDLRQGKWRFLSQQEIGRLHRAVERPATGGPGSPRRGSDGATSRRSDKSTRRSSARGSAAGREPGREGQHGGRSGAGGRRGGGRGGARGGGRGGARGGGR